MALNQFTKVKKIAKTPIEKIETALKYLRKNVEELSASVLSLQVKNGNLHKKFIDLEIDFNDFRREYYGKKNKTS